MLFITNIICGTLDVRIHESPLKSLTRKKIISMYDTVKADGE